MKKLAEERRKKEEEGLKEGEKLAVQAEAVKELQKKVVEACEEEVESLTKINRDSLFTGDLINL